VLRFALLVVFSTAFAAAAQQTAPPIAPDSGTQAVVEAGATQPSPAVAEAEAAMVKSDWKGAQSALDTWLAAHPADARALFDSGYVADAQNRLEDAAGLYRRAIEADPHSFESHLSLGLLLARQNKPGEARPELALATTLDPGDGGSALKARAWRALAQIDQPAPGSHDDPAQASSDLLEALKLSAETPADTLLAARLADEAGNAEAAEAAYRRVLATDPKSAAANAGLAHLLIGEKKYAEAEAFLRAALEQAANDTPLTAQLAFVLAAEDNAEALPLAQKLHQDHPEDAAITSMLASVLAQAGDTAGSDALYVKLLAASPSDPLLLVAHAQNLTRMMKYAEAFAAFDKATQLDPANCDGWSGLAFAASRTGQPAITLHALTMRSKYLPEVPSTYFLWATAYDTLHQKAAAATYYQHFLDAAAGKFPDQEWQARQRLVLLNKP